MSEIKVDLFWKPSMKQWRAALEHVSKISGWTSKDYRYDKELIKDVVGTMLDKVYPMFTLLGITKDPVRSDVRLKKIDLLLAPENNDVHFTGIYGVSGIGKTQIAKDVYDKCFHDFEVRIFLANIREVSATNGMVYVVNQFISKIFKQTMFTCFLQTNGTTCLYNLLVLDDVDQLYQLKILAGKKDWFGLGSRIIITTRDKSVLEHVDIEKPSEQPFGLQVNANALQGSLIVDGRVPLPPFQFVVCAGCNVKIENYGKSLACNGAVWHPECFRCYACSLPISDHDFLTCGVTPNTSRFHKSCYPLCDVCKNFLPFDSAGVVEWPYGGNPMLKQQRYYPSHELDGSRSCCSCGRKQPRDCIRDVLLKTFDPYQCQECKDLEITSTQQCSKGRLRKFISHAANAISSARGSN